MTIMVEVNCSHRIAQGLLVPLSSSSLGPSSSRRRRPPPRLAPPRRYQEPAAPQQPPRYARLLARGANPCSFASYFRRVSPVFQCHVHVSRSRATRLAILRSSVMVEILSPKIPPVEQRASQGRERLTRASGRSVRKASLRPRSPCALAYRGARPRGAAFRQTTPTIAPVKASVKTRIEVVAGPKP